ncbi:MAG: hypothetical protein ACE15C_16835 [Phycisphaerae bacterium]
MTDAATPSHPAQPGRTSAPRLRVKLLGGDLTAEQWRMLAGIASEFTPDAPLHLTTRQDVELHCMSPEQVPLILERLAEVGLTAKQSCGNTVRNVTVCPCSGVRTGAPDLGPLAWAIRRTLEGIEGDLALPRKFKISLSACEEACGQPWINDLGLVAVQSGSGWVFRVILAGSLGARPATGAIFEEALPAGDVLPLAVAALRVFAAHADRKNRLTARFRHVRQRMGDEEFAATVRQAFNEAKAERHWPAVEIAGPAVRFDSRALLTFADGDFSPQQAQDLANLAQMAEIRVRIDNHHRVVLAAGEESVLRQALAELPSLAQAASPQPSIVACPGRRWCKNGLVDTQAMADMVRRELSGELAPGTIVGICGCPSNCTHSAVAPFGLVGGRSASGEVFTLFTGGGLGQTPKLADRVAERLSAQSVIEEMRRRCADLPAAPVGGPGGCGP